MALLVLNSSYSSTLPADCYCPADRGRPRHYHTRRVPTRSNNMFGLVQATTGTERRFAQGAHLGLTHRTSRPCTLHQSCLLASRASFAACLTCHAVPLPRPTTPLAERLAPLGSPYVPREKRAEPTPSMSSVYGRRYDTTVPLEHSGLCRHCQAGCPLGPAAKHSQSGHETTCIKPAVVSAAATPCARLLNPTHAPAGSNMRADARRYHTLLVVALPAPSSPPSQASHRPG